MKVALIAPPSMLETIPQTDFHLLLPHLWGQVTYRQYYREVSGWKIVDNGAAEGHLWGVSTLMEMENDFKAGEVVAPDIMGDREGTIDLARRCRRHSSVPWMGVAQGSSILECSTTIKAMHYMHWITSIAIPRLVNEFEPNARLRLIEVAHRTGFDQIHCLGTSIRAGEVKDIAEQGIARSIDTSLPINLGLLRVRLTPDVYASRTPHYFDHPVPTPETEKLIIDNCQKYLEWAQAPSSEV